MEATKQYLPGLTVTTICKNEEENIAGMLASALKFADEVIITDTGSTDMTIPIIQAFIKKHPKRVSLTHRAWDNNFANARNHALPMARYRWLMWMDCDDRVTVDEQFEKVLGHCRQGKLNPNAVFSFDIVSGAKKDHVFEQTRIWPNGEKIHFTGMVHEILDNGRDLHDKTPVFLDCKIRHLGYNDDEKWKSKVERNYQGLLEMVKESPDNFRHKFQLANTYLEFSLREDDLTKRQALRNQTLALYLDVYERLEAQDLLRSDLAFGCAHAIGQWYGGLAENFDMATAWGKECVQLRSRESLGYIAVAQGEFCRKNPEEAMRWISMAETKKTGRTMHWMTMDYDSFYASADKIARACSQLKKIKEQQKKEAGDGIKKFLGAMVSPENPDAEALNVNLNEGEPAYA